MDEKNKETLGENQDLLKRLEEMEQLLRETRDANQKMAKHRTIMSVLMLCLVCIFAIGIFNLLSATKDLPRLIASTTTTVEQMDTTMKDISSLDFEGMNGAIGEMQKGLAKIDFEALNASILNLQKAAEGLAKVMSIFGK